MIGDGWDTWWLATGLAHFILILPAVMVAESMETGMGRARNLLMTIAGAIIYIISGSATLNFYIPQVQIGNCIRTKNQHILEGVNRAVS